MERKIICRVLTGPTASGKTGFSLRLAQEKGYEILCMDSMQIYRGMDIGTAKPTLAEQNMIPHHLLDIVDPKEGYSAAAYRDMAEELIRSLNSKGKEVLFVGGTSLYLDALVHPMAMGSVSADEKLREDLKKQAETLSGREALHQMLATMDPETAKRLPINDVRRIIRAIEVTKSTGIPFSKQPQRNEESPFQWKIVALMPERQILYKRIDQRVREMVEAGLPQEVERLLNQGVPENAQSMYGLGYKEMIPYLHGEWSLDKAVEKIALGTRHYAKRQITYLKRFDEITFIDPFEDMAWEKIKQALE